MLGSVLKTKQALCSPADCKEVNECKSGLVHCHSVGPWPHCIILLCF